MNNHKNFVMTGELSKMEKLIDFFKYKYNLVILQEFITKSNDKKEKLSLRLLDWFVTNYAKQYGTIYDIKKLNGKSEKFFVWIEYQAELDSDRKESFDPFGRGKSKGKAIELEYEEGKTLHTTLAQLSFFRWAIKYGVIDYVRAHLDHIYEDMCQRGSSTKNKSIDGKKRKLSVSVSKTLGKHNVCMSVAFHSCP